MRVVLDANILFSALISPHGKPDVIYRAWRPARFEIVTSQLQLEEFDERVGIPSFGIFCSRPSVVVMLKRRLSAGVRKN